MKKWARNTLFGGLFLYSAHAIIFPLSLIDSSNNDFRSQKVQIKTGIDSLLIENISNTGIFSYRCLKIANLAVARTYQYGNPDLGTKKDLDLATSSDILDCFSATSATYSNYVYLSDKHNRPEILENVRMVTGLMYQDGEYQGHKWLEIKLGERWRPFDATTFLGINNSSLDSLMIEGSFYDSVFFNRDSEKYYPLAHIRWNGEGFNKGIFWKNSLTNLHFGVYPKLLK